MLVFLFLIFSSFKVASYGREQRNRYSRDRLTVQLGTEGEVCQNRVTVSKVFRFVKVGGRKKAHSAWRGTNDKKFVIFLR